MSQANTPTAPLAFSDALQALKIMTTQTANFTFTDDEITQALSKAWQDSYVGQVVWDSSITYSVGTYQYPVPSTMSVVRDIYIITANNSPFGQINENYPEKISQDLYEIVAGNIQFVQLAQRWIADTYTLYLKGFNPLTTSDNLSDENQVNYVLALAAYNLLGMLLLKSTFVFLRNDTSIQQIVAARKDFQGEMLYFKGKLLREFESV